MLDPVQLDRIAFEVLDSRAFAEAAHRVTGDVLIPRFVKLLHFARAEVGDVTEIGVRVVLVALLLLLLALRLAVLVVLVVRIVVVIVPLHVLVEALALDQDLAFQRLRRWKILVAVVGTRSEGGGLGQCELGAQDALYDISQLLLLFVAAMVLNAEDDWVGATREAVNVDGLDHSCNGVEAGEEGRKERRVRKKRRRI